VSVQRETVRDLETENVRVSARNSENFENSAPSVVPTAGNKSVHGTNESMYNRGAAVEPRQPPRPDRVNRELARLQGFNDPGGNEGAASGTRQRRAPSRFAANTIISDSSNREFEYHFTNFVGPDWNEERQWFETTEGSTRDNPFTEGFYLDPTHPSFVPFAKTEQQTDVTLGYYLVPSAYLGYHPDEAPNIYVHQIEMPQELLFERKLSTDPDTLTWDEAMNESPEEVKKWLEAAKKEVKALKAKQTWKEVPLSTSTVKVIPGTWVFRRKRAPDGAITKMKARWVLRGDLLDVDFETNAPVVAWPPV
jgi:hypothetical protein